MRIGLAYDLRSDSTGNYPEHDTIETIDLVVASLTRLGASVERLGNFKQVAKALASGSRSFDLVVNLCEGRRVRSREAHLPALMEEYSQVYTFSDPTTLAVCLDKRLFKSLCGAFGLPVPSSRTTLERGGMHLSASDFPLFVKPAFEGTSVGVDDGSVVHDEPQLRKRVALIKEQFGQPAVIEEFLPGEEFTVGVVGTGQKAKAVGIARISIREPGKYSVYGREQKERSESLVVYSPVDVTSEMGRLLASTSCEAHAVFECRDASRVDLRLDRAGRPKLLEINPLPGMHPTHSDLPILAAASGMTYDELWRVIIESSLERKVDGCR